MTPSTSPSFGIVALAAAGLFAVGLSVPVSAQAAKAPARSDDRAATRAERPDPNQVICVRAELGGSRLRHDVCLTRRQWQLDGGVPTADDR